MGYSNEVIRRARQRLEQARSDRERQIQEHLDIAYSQQPRLKEIDRLLRMTMAKAACAVFSGGDAATLMEQAKQENLSLQHERQQIIDSCFEKGFLDEKSICSTCGGYGYVGSNMCSCLAELCRQEQTKELTFLSAGQEQFDQFRLDYYSDRPDPRTGYSPRMIMERTFQHCYRYAMDFSLEAGNLLFSGNAGLGKTFLSACIAREVANRGHSVVYESAGHLFQTLEKARFEASDENRRAAAKYNECDLLIVDDLGTELSGQFVTAALYTLINDRLIENKPTIISTNLVEDDFVKRYGPQIASRLKGCYRRMTFVGDDIRQMMNKRGIR